MGGDVRYGIAELADLGGVSRRTVRYYVQEGLLPPPLGVGRGDHYGAAHLERLQQVRALQEAGLSLDDIRGRLRGGPPAVSAPAARAAAPAVPSLGTAANASPPAPVTWRRVALAPGVELHVRAGVPLPSAARLEELATWCRRHLGHDGDRDRED